MSDERDRRRRLIDEYMRENPSSEPPSTPIGRERFERWASERPSYKDYGRPRRRLPSQMEIEGVSAELSDTGQHVRLSLEEWQKQSLIVRDLERGRAVSRLWDRALSALISVIVAALVAWALSRR